MPDRQGVDGAIETCAKLLREGSRSFHAASLLLPRRMVAPATVLYAFCREADDTIDESSDPAAGVRRVQARLDAVYEGRPEPGPVDRAFTAIVQAYGIPKNIPEAMVEGFAWDACGRSYENLSEVVDYSVRVASTVGLMMTLLMGERRPDALARASDLGVAMQLTNIARDVGEDARMGRLYLPRSWMREEGIDPERWLSAPEYSAGIARVVARLIAHARGLYRRADEGIRMLPRDCRPAIRSASLIYEAIGNRIASDGYDSVTRRAVVPGWRKGLLVLRALPWALSSSVQFSSTPCLSEAESIVRAVAGTARVLHAPTR